MSRLVVYDPKVEFLDTRLSSPLFSWLDNPFRWPFDIAAWWDEAFSVDNLRLDVYETDDDLVVKASLPGIKAEDINVEERDGILTIQASSKEEAERERYGWHIQERRYGSWQRSLRLPVEVDGAKARAELKDGILTITLPKTAAAKKPANRIKVSLPKVSLPKLGKKEQKVKVNA